MYSGLRTRRADGGDRDAPSFAWNATRCSSAMTVRPFGIDQSSEMCRPKPTVCVQSHFFSFPFEHFPEDGPLTNGIGAQARGLAARPSTPTVRQRCRAAHPHISCAGPNRPQGRFPRAWGVGRKRNPNPSKYASVCVRNCNATRCARRRAAQAASL